jgi:hypothetical protein
VVCWFNLGTEAVSFGVFGATEEFEILRSIIKADAIFVMNVLVGDGSNPRSATITSRWIPIESVVPR